MSSETVNESQNKCAKLVVHGRVQGVGFRYFTQTTARQYGILGWVRNNYNGTVEIWAEGQLDSLKTFIKRIERGPSGSYVRKIDIQWQPPQNKYDSFVIRT